MQIAFSSSARNELVGFGMAIEKQPTRYRKVRLKVLSVTLGARTEQNPFSAELATMAHTLKTLVGLKAFLRGEILLVGGFVSEGRFVIGPPPQGGRRNAGRS